MKQLFGQSAMPWVKAVAMGLSWVFSPLPQALAQSPQSAQESPASPAVETPKTYPPVQVVDTPLEYRQFERVEITGSAILSKEAKQALPLQVIDRREIERSGAASLSELIQRLPVMSNFSELGTVTGTPTGGPEAAAIHGNQSGTLVLLNGRRLPYYGSQTIMGERAVVDLNFVPLVAIERIEILADGASSRYGSDAVAGVINIITKSELQGLGISVDKVLSAGGHGQAQGVNLSWGRGRLQRDGYNVRAYFTAEKKEALLAKDREVASQGARSLQIDGQTWWQKFNYSAYGAPARNYLDAAGVMHNEHYTQTGQCEAGWYELDRGQCYKNTQGDMTLYPATDKQMLYVQADKLLDNRWVLFAEGLAGRHSQVSVPSGAYWTRDVPNADQTRTYLLDIVPLNLVQQKYTNQIHNAVLGLRGEQSGWDFVSSFSSGRHKVDRVYTGGLIQGEYEAVFVPSAMVTQDPALYDASMQALFAPYRRTTVRPLDTGTTRLDSFQFLASREWLETDDGPVTLGVGLDWRRESVAYNAPGSTVRPSFDAIRRNWATHAEVNVPTGDSSEVVAAVRHDEYSDFGGVQTGKLGWKWKPSAQWLWRASLGTGFRAPSMGQMVNAQSPLSAHYDPVTRQYLPVINQGNSQLKPEKSVQGTWGLRFEPGQRLSLGADLWQVRIHDTFGNLTGGQILGDPVLSAQYLINGTMYQPNQNLGTSIKRGIDYDLQWREPTEWGRLRMTLRGAYLLKSARQDAVTGVYVSDVGVQNDEAKTAMPRHQWALSAMFERSDWAGGLSLHYRAGLLEKTTLTNQDGQSLPYAAKVPGYWTLDVSSRWQLQPDLTLSASVVNLTDRLPPLRMAFSENVLMGVDTRYANYLGRNLRMKLEYKFY